MDFQCTVYMGVEITFAKLYLEARVYTVIEEETD